MADLVQSQPRPVGTHQNRAVFGIARVLDECDDFLTREDLRQLLRLTRPRDVELRRRALERDAIEELQSLKDDVAARPGELPLLDQVEQIVLYFLLCDAVRLASVVLRQSCDRTEIRLARAYRHPTNHQISIH